MGFIAILIATTMAIAGSAAYFSVYGLASTFSGTFWSVVIMGGSLEAGKLVAASYLYRYWKKMGGWGWMLKSYMIAGIVTLMFLTSAGIFGYLSSGYQADVLPLKQQAEQIRLLEDERTRSLDRKKQIDDQIAKGPIVSNVQRGEQIDPNAARTLNAATRARESMNRQFQAEQKQLVARISDLDKQLLQLKQEQIKTEAHIGPITYIAKAFNYETDEATKILIFLIIFAFDPMAIALTIGVNIALQLHRDEKQPKVKEDPREDREYKSPTSPVDWSSIQVEKLTDIKPEQQVQPEPTREPEPEPEPERTEPVPEQSQPVTLSQNIVLKDSQENLNELIQHYRMLQGQQKLSGEDQLLMKRIEEILTKHGLIGYLR